MPKAPPHKSKRQHMKELKLIWFVGFIVMLAMGVFYLLKLVSGEGFYVQSYKPQVEQANEYRRMEAEQASDTKDEGSDKSQTIDNKGLDERKQEQTEKKKQEDGGSAEPRPYGFAEKDIDKSQGNRYKAF